MTGLIKGEINGMQNGAISFLFELNTLKGLDNINLSRDEIFSLGAYAGMCNYYFKITADGVIARIILEKDLQDFPLSNVIQYVVRQKINNDPKSLKKCFSIFRELYF